MKLTIKRLELRAGRPVALLNERRAAKLNVHIGDRIEVSKGSRKIIAVVDIVKDLLDDLEISLSKETLSYLNAKPGESVEVNLALSPKSTNPILKKLNGQSLTREEIHEIITDIVNNSLTEAEIAYFVSAVYEKGMSLNETIYLTEAMYKTGKKLSWHSSQIVDKHSIGGIPGNRTTPIVVSICAASGVIMPKTSSRAITTAAGTADVMDVICHVNLSPEELKSIVKKTNACLAWGGSLGLAPADDKLIRVERLLNLDPESQLLASILSKKLAVGSKYVLIDIPCGEGAKVSKAEAAKLKSKFIKIAKHFELNIQVVLTKGDQPIGNGIGPILEILDILRVLKQENSPKDLERKALFLASKILEMTGKAKKGKGLQMAKEILYSGAAYAKFNEIIDAQGRKSKPLVPARFRKEIKATKDGRVQKIENKILNKIGRILGSPADKGAGMYIYVHKSDKVSKGDKLITFYSESEKKIKEAIAFYNQNKLIKLS